MQRRVLGVDGGGTKTRALVVDQGGAVVGHAVGASTNVNTLPATTVAANLARVVAAATEGDLAAAVFGVAGVNGEADAATFRALVAGLEGHAFARVEVVNDTVISLAGGLGGGEGVVLIAGTGSNCLGRRSDGRAWQAGGLESIIDDGGSGYDLGRRGLVAAVRAADRRGARTDLQPRLFAALGVHSASEVPRRLHYEGPDGPGHPMTKAQVAALAPVVLEVAAAGDAVALGVLRAAVSELALLVQTVVREVAFARAPVRVCMVGSVGQSAQVWRELERQLAAAGVAAELVLPALPPVAGAALLALEHAGVAVDAAIVAALRASLPPGL